MFHTETLSCKTLTNSTVDGYSTQAQVSQCHNGFHASYGFPDLIHLHPTESIYIGAYSGFEPKMPVYIRT
jgi:hypothetical protein